MPGTLTLERVLHDVGARVTTSLTLGSLPALATAPFTALLAYVVGALHAPGEDLGRTESDGPVAQTDDATAVADARPLVDSFGHHRSSRDPRPRVLDLTALVVGGELWLIWGYSTNLHCAATVRALADRFTGELAAVTGERR